MTKTEAFNWFAKFKSIETDFDLEKNHIVPISQETKELRINLYKIGFDLEIESEWKFASQNYDQAYISLGKCLIQIRTIFTNKSEQLVKTEIFYFDLSEEDLELFPLPIMSQTIRVSDGEFRTIKNDRIWKGDFDYIIEQINTK
ncbi:hypothetical protein [Gaetbulibacter jejuensis]|uniref:hypothetical protein n=1 Tax=Gaetbulibacter jejuensis TaxID=584607 RepID=UPI00300BAAB8